MKKKKNIMAKKFFTPENAQQLKKDPLSNEEIAEGNALFLEFLNLVKPLPNEIEAAEFHLSYDKLIEVSVKIETFGVERSSDAPMWINVKRFNYKHQMFHEILYFNDFYRSTVKFVKHYFRWLAGEPEEVIAA